MYNTPTLEEAWDSILNSKDDGDMETQVINAIELSFSKAMVSNMEPQETAMTLAGKMTAEYGECQDRAREILTGSISELEKMKEHLDDDTIERIGENIIQVENDITSLIAMITFKLSEVSTEMKEKTDILVRKPEAYSFVANTYEYVMNHFLDFKKEMQTVLVSLGSEVTDESFNNKIYEKVQEEIKKRGEQIDGNE